MLQRLERELGVGVVKTGPRKRHLSAAGKATILDLCRDLPLVGEARKNVNDVLREIGTKDEMGKKTGN